MFTGIIESVGEVLSVSREGKNIHYRIASDISHELKVDQSVAHQGACLTVTAQEDGWHEVTAIDETLSKTNLKTWKEQTRVNLERCMRADGRYDGHMVYGHVDQVATCIDIKDMNGSTEFTFQYIPGLQSMVVEKGSICLNGISLTVYNVTKDVFSVAIIPYTFEHTTMKDIRIGSLINVEFDIIGKYVAKMMKLD